MMPAERSVWMPACLPRKKCAITSGCRGWFQHGSTLHMGGELQYGVVDRELKQCSYSAGSRLVGRPERSASAKARKGAAPTVSLGQISSNSQVAFFHTFSYDRFNVQG